MQFRKFSVLLNFAKMGDCKVLQPKFKQQYLTTILNVTSWSGASIKTASQMQEKQANLKDIYQFFLFLSLFTIWSVKCFSYMFLCRTEAIELVHALLQWRYNKLLNSSSKKKHGDFFFFLICNTPERRKSFIRIPSLKAWKIRTKKCVQHTSREMYLKYFVQFKYRTC